MLASSSSVQQTLLEKIKTLYNDTPGLSPDKIAPTVGQNSTRCAPLPFDTPRAETSTKLAR